MSPLTLLPAPSSLPCSEVEWPHFVSICVQSCGNEADGAKTHDIGEAWLDRCYALTPHVERIDAQQALLDLGVCADEEAGQALQPLLCWLREAGLRAQVGIGPSATVAQLARLRLDHLARLPDTRNAAQEPVRDEESPSMTWEDTPVRGVPLAQARAFLRAVPVRLLGQLHAGGRIEAGVIDRLERFGLTTLGHIARLDESALRAQFGAAPGALLATLAAGRDPRPLVPTPRSERMRLRVSFSTAADGEHVLGLAPLLARQASKQLHCRRQAVGAMAIVLHREGGGAERVEVRLREPASDDAHLAIHISQLLRRALAGDAKGKGDDDARSGQREQQWQRAGRPLERIEALKLTLAQLEPARPAPSSLWSAPSVGVSRVERQQRQETLERVAERLAQRHSRLALARIQQPAPLALFSEERYCLTPLGNGPISSAHTASARSASATGRKPAAEGRAEGQWERVRQELHWW